MIVATDNPATATGVTHRHRLFSAPPCQTPWRSLFPAIPRRDAWPPQCWQPATLSGAVSDVVAPPLIMLVAVQFHLWPPSPAHRHPPDLAAASRSHLPSSRLKTRKPARSRADTVRHAIKLGMIRHRCLIWHFIPCQAATPRRHNYQLGGKHQHAISASVGNDSFKPETTNRS